MAADMTPAELRVVTERLYERLVYHRAIQLAILTDAEWCGVRALVEETRAVEYEGWLFPITRA